MGWYFSTMPTSSPASLDMEVVEFHRTKYGPELLIDAGWVSGYRDFERGGRPHRLAFHDILLITRGEGRLVLDVETHEVAPGTVFFSRPLEARRWDVPEPVEGACVFFVEEFVGLTFTDPRFLDRFAYFGAHRPTGALVLDRPERREYLDRFAAMQREIEILEADSPDALRAVLYDFLVQLNRFYLARHPARHPDHPGAGPSEALSDPPPRGPVERFVQQVEKDYRDRHRVSDYAAQLGLTPGHLNALCREVLHTSAGAWLRARRVLEAQRLLLYTDLTAAEIGHRLGFDDPSYFSRFFRRETGRSPTVFRRETEFRKEKRDG